MGTHCLPKYFRCRLPLKLILTVHLLGSFLPRGEQPSNLLMNANYQTTQRRSSDPKRVVDAPTVYIYKCGTCGAETTSYRSESSFCEKCQKYMNYYSRIDSGKVKNILNRTVDFSRPEEVKKDPLEQAWDDGLIRSNVLATVRPIAGTGKLEILGRFSKEAWLDKVVKINGSVFRLSDIGRALGEML